MRLFFMLVLFCFPLFTEAQIPSAEEVLKRSIQYHDPANQLYSKDFSFYFDESRPDGSIRKTTVRLAPKKEYFQIEREQSEQYVLTMLHKNNIQYFIDGKEIMDENTLNALKLDDVRSTRIKNYYLYLWHLPVKLLDAGTLLDSEIMKEEFNGKLCYKLGVRYEEKVGSDRWYFYFDMHSYAMVGYRFYHDESQNDGEYIYLEGEYINDLIRLPKTRKWYTHKEDKYLGTDSLIKMLEHQ